MVGFQRANNSKEGELCIDFEYFDCDMLRHGFLHVCFDFLTVNLCLPPYMGSFQPLLSKYFYPILLRLCFSNYDYLSIRYFNFSLEISVHFFQCFSFSSLFWLVSIDLPSNLLLLNFLCHLHSAISTVEEILYFRHYIFLVLNLLFGVFHIFCFSNEIFYIFIPYKNIFLYLVELSYIV